MRKKKISKKKANKYEEVITDEKKEYPKAGIFTEGEVTDEIVIKKFNIEEFLKDKNIKVASMGKEDTIENVNSINNTEKKRREAFTIKKTFTMRESTAKMLVKLRLEHPNINVRTNVILDKAVRFYYKHVMEKGLSQEEEI